MFYELESHGILRKIYGIFAENATVTNIRNYQIINILTLKFAENPRNFHGKYTENLQNYSASFHSRSLLNSILPFSFNFFKR